jgi:hypothetical protein
MSDLSKVLVGLDVHKDSISVGVAQAGQQPARFVGKIAHDVPKLLKQLERIAPPAAMPSGRAGDDDAELGEQAAQAVDERVALLDPALAGAVPAQDGLRLDGLDRHEAHGGLARGDASAAVRRALNVIALWLGHESTNTTHRYVEADLAMKEKALARLEAPDTKLRRFRASDSLMRFLQTL